ncbi:MAG: glycosyltransferase family 4 protein [Paenibacillaceae bacterium]|nr:glycosyltransferase family 4 protein [Paenibacillaceae bacterium]
MKAVKKVLLVTTVSGFVPQFEMSNVHILQSMGYEVHYASNYHTPSYGTDNHRLDGTGIIRHQIDFVRSPFTLQNIKVYRQLKKVMSKERFDLVHCHTPMGGVMARLVAHSTKTSPVIYTAHGFHFFKGASLINWLCYYPMEKFLSRFTDEQICINLEDYQRAKEKFHAKHTSYIPGVGLDISKIKPSIEINIKKLELGLPTDRLILLSTGELIQRKNHETVIRAIGKLKAECSDVMNAKNMKFHYVICGHGKLEEYLKRLAQELQVNDCISFLGYREDMMEIYQIADLFLFPSYQEGLPMALLEAMAYGLPVICSDIRGSRDLMRKNANAPLDQCDGGILIAKADDVPAYSNAIQQLLCDRRKRQEMGNINSLRATEFSIKNVKESMEKIYRMLLT